MLCSFRHYDDRLSVDGRELGTAKVKGHTVETLMAIQGENPEAEVYFIFGGDKLKGLSGWSQFDALVSGFKVIIFERNGPGLEDASEVIDSDPKLSAYRDAFVLLQSPPGVEGISSTLVRENLSKNEAVGDMLTHEVYTMLLADRQRR